MIYALGHVNLIKLSKQVVGIADEVLVYQVYEFVFCAVLNFIVILGLSECSEVLAHEVVEIDIHGGCHAFFIHCRAAVTEEIEVLHPTN